MKEITAPICKSPRNDRYRANLEVLHKPFLVSAGQTQLTVKAETHIKLIEGASHRVISFDVDTTFAVADKLDTGIIQAGKDYYVYATTAGTIFVSLNSTYPTGFTANNSRKIGGFHTLCSAVGTRAGRPTNGYATGAIIPTSVWCLNHRPINNRPEGMAYLDLTHTHLGPSFPSVPKIPLWVDIYKQSGTGGTTSSAYGATITDTRAWDDHSDDLAAVGKRLLYDHEFSIAMTGSPAQTNIYGSQDPVTTGKCAPRAFTGAGLNDLTVSRTAYVPPAGSATEAQEYEVEIDAAGTPDTFKWRQRNPAGTWSSYTTGVAITGAAQVLADGITVTFGATTGHTLANKWNLYVMNGTVDTAGVRQLSDHFVEGGCGVMWQWLLNDNYRFDGAANHTHSVTVTGDPETVTSGNPSGDVAPAWGYQALGTLGSFYKQGTFGQGVKLLAGGAWYYGSNCGPRCRSAYNPRWSAYSYFGARGCAEPA